MLPVLRPQLRTPTLDHLWQTHTGPSVTEDICKSTNGNRAAVLKAIYQRTLTARTVVCAMHFALGYVVHHESADSLDQHLVCLKHMDGLGTPGC